MTCVHSFLNVSNICKNSQPNVMGTLCGRDTIDCLHFSRVPRFIFRRIPSCLQCSIWYQVLLRCFVGGLDVSSIVSASVYRVSYNFFVGHWFHYFIAILLAYFGISSIQDQEVQVQKSWKMHLEMLHWYFARSEL